MTVSQDDTGAEAAGLFDIMENCEDKKPKHFIRVKAIILLACEFLATDLRILSRTFARHSCECREDFHVLRTSRELVAKV